MSPRNTKNEKEPWHNFAVHGFDKTESAGGGQVRGDCPLCGKEDKFYLNPDTTLWDCKACGASGNWNTFLAQIHDRNKDELDTSKGPAKKWLKEKRLPAHSAIACGLGHNPFTDDITIPAYNAQGKISQLRRLAGNKWYVSPGGKKGLINGDKIDRGDDTQIVNVVEGESDLLTLYGILMDTGRISGETVVSLPGVSTFDPEWMSLLNGKEVRTWFDADEAGEKASDKWAKNCLGIAGSIRVADWGDDRPKGFDLRDFIAEQEGPSPDDVYESLYSMLGLVKSAPSSGMSSNVGSAGGSGTAKDDWISDAESLSPEEMIEAYRKWIHLPDEDILRALFGCIWANRIESRDPVWMSLIGPPSDGKSTLIMSLAGIPMTHPMTQATPASLVPGNGQPGVIERANLGTILLKDATAIFGQDKRVTDEVMGIFRDAYDGRVSKTFGGNIGEVRIISHFGFIMGTTRDFERHRDTAVGERLLLYRMADIDDDERRERMGMVLQSLSGGSSSSQEEDLRRAAAGFMSWKRSKTPPTIPQELSERLMDLAEFVSSARAMVIRDSFHRDNVFSKREKELPTRLFRQFVKQAIGCAWAWGRPEVGEDEMRVVSKMAWDTPPERDSDMLESIFNGDPSKGVTVEKIAEESGYPQSTCHDRVEDFSMLGLVEKSKASGRGSRWMLNKRFRQTMAASFSGLTKES